MQKTVNFTIRTLDALKTTDKRYYVYDSKVQGLQVAVFPSGTKTFYLYKKVQGKPERMKLGRYPEISIENARTMATKLIGKIAEGNNPQDIKRAERAETTFSAFYQKFMDDHSRVHNSPAVVEFNEMQFRNYLKAAFGSKKLSKITRQDVQSFHTNLGTISGKTSANRILTLLASVFNKAIEWEYLTGENPTKYIQRFKVQSRERFLNAEELPRLMTALNESQNYTVRDYVFLSLLTGARKANLLAMQWADIDFTSKTWRIPKTKNGEAQTIPLVEQALIVLNNRKAEHGKSDYVFPSKSATGHLADPKRGWATLLKQAKIDDFHLHDLRRTLGSWQAANGTSLHVIGKSLGHKSSRATEIYARLDLDPVRGAMESAANNMLGMSNG